jgi:hypothetical protein
VYSMWHLSFPAVHGACVPSPHSLPRSATRGGHHAHHPPSLPHRLRPVPAPAGLR